MRLRPRAVLLGHPVAHSCSPALMAELSRRSGFALRYEPWDVLPEGLGDALRRVRAASDILGANITLPHKVAVRAHVERCSDTASAVGAANVLVKEDAHAEAGGGAGGVTVVAHNTDVRGFLDMLVFHGLEVAGRRVLLLGAGGAARAVAWALLEQGASRILVWNRSPEPLRALEAMGGGRIRGVAPGDSPLGAPEVEVVVHATSLGLQDGDGARARAAFGGLLAGVGAGGPLPAVDVVYRPSGRTAFLRLALASGLQPLCDGAAMLAAQAVHAFNLWTGARLDPADHLPGLVGRVRSPLAPAPAPKPDDSGTPRGS